MSKKGIVSIHGKQYKTVVLRVNEFHANKTDTQRITTDLVYHDEKRVIMKAVIWDSDVVIGTGYGEEWRESSNINKTSALECAETSAIGRALACIGLGGDEYASADEVLRAISQQNVNKAEGWEPSADDKPQSTEDDAWSSPDIPDDILEIVQENFKIMKKREGKDKTYTWHSRVLPNFLNVHLEEDYSVVEAIKSLDKPTLLKLSELQNEQLKLNTEE